jgi:hypothetical protein
VFLERESLALGTNDLGAATEMKWLCMAVVSLIALTISAEAANSQLSPNEIAELQHRLAKLWVINVRCDDLKKLIVNVRVRLGPDRRLSAVPEVVLDKETGSTPEYQAAISAAVRAIQLAQPFDMLRSETYEAWKYMEVTFDPQILQPEATRRCTS